MNNESLLQFKQSVHHSCIEIIQNKLLSLRSEIAHLKESAEQETKSSMGDKYETARTMVQLEMNHLHQQQQQLQKQLNILHSIKVARKRERADFGSLIKASDNCMYYLAVGMGQIELKGQRYIVISPASKLGKLFMGTRPGSTVRFEDQLVAVHDIA
jgi:transcription elongation GreA/GreB family factor